MHTDLETSARAPRRALGLLAAGVLAATLGLAACSDHAPETPAISGKNPAEVTVPSLPTTTVPVPTTAAGGATTTTAADGGATTTTAP